MPRVWEPARYGRVRSSFRAHAAGAEPLRLARQIALLLPDRHSLLQLLDHIAGGSIGITLMRCRHRDRDADFPDLQPSEPVDHVDAAGVPPLTRLPNDRIQRP